MFIARNPDGSIYGAWSVSQKHNPDVTEELPDDHPEVVAFMAPKPPPVLTPEQKLAAIGLTVDDLKALIAGK